MRIIAKMLLQIALTLALLVTGFAFGYPIGKHMGFEMGSEWVWRQADLIARDAGVSMPVYFEDGSFHVVIRQAPDLYKRTRQEAVQHDEIESANVTYANTDRTAHSAIQAPAP